MKQQRTMLRQRHRRRFNKPMNNTSESNELLAKDIQYIKDDIKIINEKLDKKYVSHETFDLTVKSLNMAIKAVGESSQEGIKLVARIGIFIISPIYAAMIALIIKIFIQ